jgi:hypothetical protein
MYKWTTQLNLMLLLSAIKMDGSSCTLLILLFFFKSLLFVDSYETPIDIQGTQDHVKLWKKQEREQQF